MFKSLLIAASHFFDGDLRRRLQDDVDEAELLGLVRIHESVPFEHLLNNIDLLIGMLRVELVDGLLRVENLLGVNQDVGGLAAGLTRRLMDHDARVRQRVAHSGSAGRQQQTGHAAGLADAPGRYRRQDVLHGVVNAEAGGHHAARAVDVHVHRLLGALRLQKQQLGDDQGGHLVRDRAHHADDALLQQPRVDVVGALAAARLLHHDRNQIGVWRRRVQPSPLPDSCCHDLI